MKQNDISSYKTDSGVRHEIITRSHYLSFVTLGKFIDLRFNFIIAKNNRVCTSEKGCENLMRSCTLTI